MNGVPRLAISQLEFMRALLQTIPILAGLDEAALDLLWARATQSEAQAGSVVVREGEAGNRLFVISEGLVRVCKDFGKPHEIELTRLGRGEFFGEMCILDTLPRSATVQAITDTSLFSLNSLTFHQLYKAAPAQYSILVLNLARDLSRRLRRLDEKFAARS